MGTSLKLIISVNTAISIVRALKSVPEDSVASLAESLLGIVSDIEHDVEDVTHWMVFLTSSCF